MIFYTWAERGRLRTLYASKLKAGERLNEASMWNTRIPPQAPPYDTKIDSQPKSKITKDWEKGGRDFKPNVVVE